MTILYKAIISSRFINLFFTNNTNKIVENTLA